MRYGELRVWGEQWGDTPVIGAEGEVDLGTVDSLRALTSEVVRRKPAAVIFDFRKVTFIDSSGLGILVATRKRLMSEPDSVTVVTAQPAVLQSLQLTGLDRVLRVVQEVAVQTNAG
jgi:anti-sigma B factor antagonist